MVSFVIDLDILSLPKFKSLMLRTPLTCENNTQAMLPSDCSLQADALDFKYNNKNLSGHVTNVFPIAN